MYRGFLLLEARSVVFYEVLRLWEAHLYVFYVSGRLSGLTEWWDRVCPLKKDRHGRGGRGSGGGEARSVVFYEGLRLWEARFVVFYVSGRLSGGTMSNDAVSPGVSAKERPSRAWGEGEGEVGAGIIMSSNDVGSYECKRSPWMQMEECSATLARSTSDGSADYHNNSNNKINHNLNNNNKDNNNKDNPPTHRWSSVLDLLNILPFASHMVTA